MASIVLYTTVTPNGSQVSIFLEELKAAYPNAGIKYESVKHHDFKLLLILPIYRSLHTVSKS
jgi:hypothetical protein